MDTFKPIADIAMRKVNRVAPQEIRMAFQDGVTTGVKFVNGALIVVGALETLVDLKDHNPEAGIKVIKCGKQILEYLFPKSKFLLGSIENLCIFSKSVDETMSKEEMSDEDRGNAIFKSCKNLIESQIENSPNLKLAQEVVKSEKVVKEVKELNKSRQVEKDAIKKFVINIAKLVFPNVGILIDGTTLPKRCLVLAKKLGVEKLFENYSQTDIDADGQISWGVPDIESSEKVINKKYIDSDEAKSQALDSTTLELENKFFNKEKMYEFFKNLKDAFNQMEKFEVNEEGDVDRLKEMSEHPDLPRTQEVSYRTLAMMSKYGINNMVYKFKNYSPVVYDIEGQKSYGLDE